MQVVKDNLLHHLVDLLLLSQNDISLPLNGRLLELAVLEDIADDVDCFWDVVPEGLCVVYGLLARGVGVQVGAEVLDLELESVLGALAGTLRRCDAKRSGAEQNRTEKQSALLTSV